MLIFSPDHDLYVINNIDISQNQTLKTQNDYFL